jgi:hypothetical protein
MKWLQLAGVGFLTLTLVIPVQAQDKKKDKTPATEPIDAEKALKPGKIPGKLTMASESSLRLRVESIRYELKPGAKPDQGTQQLLNLQQRIGRAQQRALNARNQNEYVRALQELQNLTQQLQLEATKQQLGLGGQQSPYKEVKEYKEYDIELSEKVKFRIKTLPFAYDDMGNPKKYNDDEKKALKGDETEQKLEGYKAEGIKVGQEVTVTLSKNKETENKLRGTLVVITKDADEPVKEGKKPKKKKE